ncbi:MAG: hypothetical protein U0892_20915 [Pirellulales bacterium]
MFTAVMFWLLWAIDVAALAVLTWFFLKGLQRGTVTSRNTSLWAKILGIAAAAPTAGLFFQLLGYTLIGIGIAGIPAVPCLLYVGWIVMILITKPRWN